MNKKRKVYKNLDKISQRQRNALNRMAGEGWEAITLNGYIIIHEDGSIEIQNAERQSKTLYDDGTVRPL